MPEAKAPTDAPTTMVRVFPGVYAGEHLRVERVGRYWEATARLRDVASDRGIASGILEFDPEGAWMPLGHYGSVEMCESAFALVRSGTHLVHEAYGTGTVTWAAGIVPRARALEMMAERGIAAGGDEPAAPSGP